MVATHTKQPLILQVALFNPVRRHFDYLLPANQTNLIPRIGQRIKIPFGSRNVIGIIIGISNHSELTQDKLRRAHSILDEQTPLPPQLVALCLWTAHYYHHPLGDVFSNALPNKLRQESEPEQRKQQTWFTTEKGRLLDITSLQRSPKQHQALVLLRLHANGLSSATLKQLGFNQTILGALEKKQLIESRANLVATIDPLSLLKEAELILTDEQHQSLQQILASSPGSVSLLYGITGSGKTEIYLQVIHHILKQGKQALILVPEIGLTPQTVARFEHRFKVPIVLMHSSLNDTERLESWWAANKGEARIIIGTRSAIFIPLHKPGIIIVDEEHDLSYKQQEGLRYSARDLAVLRGKMEQMPVVLGSATPSLESILNARLGRYQLTRLTHRSNNSQSPSIQLLDIRQQKLQFGLSPKLIEQIKIHLDLKNQVLLFINRRGFAPVLLCQQCGWTAECQRCNTRYTLHKSPSHLHCHHCNDIKTIPTQCEACGSTDLKPLGAGTERVEEGLNILFPDTPLVRVDRDSTQRKHSFKEKLAEVGRGTPLLLLGTQMLAKGHHFPNVTLVAIINADSGFLSADFRGPERMAQLIIQVAGRAGRAEKPGHVLLQSVQPHHPALQKLLQQGYSALCEELLKERQDVQLPPYTHAALFRAEAHQRELCYEFLDQVLALLSREREQAKDTVIELLGPTPAPMEKRAGRFRAQLLLQCTIRKQLHHLLKVSLPEIDRLKTARKVRWSLDIDPVDFL